MFICAGLKLQELQTSVCSWKCFAENVHELAYKDNLKHEMNFWKQNQGANTRQVE